MAQKRLSMRKIREVLRLRWECKLPYRAIARSCSAGASSVHDCVRRAKASGLSWPLPEGLDESALYHLLYPDDQRSASATERPLPDCASIHAELRRKAVTLRLLWVEYREAHPEGYGCEPVL